MSLEQRVEAAPQARVSLRPRAPFHFEGTVHKPSRFPTSSVAHEPRAYLQTLRRADRLLGVRMDDRGSRREPHVELTLYADGPLEGALVDEVARELAFRFDLDADLREFSARFRSDPVLGPPLARWEGMRVSSAYSLYEYLVVAIVLQNATVRRSATMLQTLFERYGTRVRFDGKELFAFWPPERLAAVPEDELRVLKMGYRAKALRRVSEALAAGEVEEAEIRRLDRERAKTELLRLYGIGPASVWYVLFDVFHHYDAFDVVSPWEQKIFSRLLFGEELAPAEKVLEEVARRFAEWRMLASHYVFEDLFWRHRRKPISWLGELIRL